MLSRRPDETHRAATPLELLFDLCFVVAVAQAASGLHHELAEGHIAAGVRLYVMVFFGIWWAWMNFTWFASAYDTDDAPYRIATFVQMSGVLVLAAGVPRVFASDDISIIVAGYVLMRLAMASQWLRAATTDSERRASALRYAAGISVLQVCWVGLLFLPDAAFVPGFVLFAVGELAVPVWAEAASATSWHPSHIAERYGLFTIIVLGESILAATVALQSAIDLGHDEINLGVLAVSGLVMVFSMWWLYFDGPGHFPQRTSFASFAWGYGHYLVFAAIAAAGAGMVLAVDHEAGVSHLSTTETGYAVAVPITVYLLSVWLLRFRQHGTLATRAAFSAALAVVLLSPLSGVAVPMIASTLGALVVLTALLPDHPEGRHIAH